MGIISQPPQTSVQTGFMANLVEEITGGPFIFNTPPTKEGLLSAVKLAAKHNCHQVDFLLSDPSQIEPGYLNQILEDHGVEIGAIGSGGIAAVYKLFFTHPSRSHRQQAVHAAKELMGLGKQLGRGVPIIIGSMQGRHYESNATKTPDGEYWPMAVDAHHHLGECLRELDSHAQSLEVPLIYEALNSGESNLFGTWAHADSIISGFELSQTSFLLDSYHWLCMDWSEEQLVKAKTPIGYAHIVDLDRKPVGQFGDTTTRRLGEFRAALQRLNYHGPLIAECKPDPNPDAALAATMDWVREHFAISRA